MQTRVDADGRIHLTGRLHNIGAQEATIPHILVTLYDAQNRVLWVDDFYQEEGIRPQRTQPFEEINPSVNWAERIPLPEDAGYASLRVSVNYFVGATQ